jgi:acetyl esterase/lipase
MNYRKTLYNNLSLPAYWKACREAKTEMDISEERITYGDHRRQYGLVVSPPEEKVRPGHYAIYFHGGGWTFGKPETFVSATKPWVERGYRVIMPSYRRPPTVGLNGVVEDCRAAIRRFAPVEKIVDLQIGGISAGAHLASLMALDKDLWTTSGWPQAPSAVLACAGPLSFEDLRPQRLFLPRYQHLNPLAVLAKSTLEIPARWLLIHGSADATVSALHSHKFHEELKSKGLEAELLTVPNGTHLDSGRWMFGGVGEAEVGRFLDRNSK